MQPGVSLALIAAERPIPPTGARASTISAETKAIQDRAAAMRGQKLSEFMLVSARRLAEETILDQRVFFPEPKAHNRFLAMLDAPAKPSGEVRERLNRKTAWED